MTYIYAMMRFKGFFVGLFLMAAMAMSAQNTKEFKRIFFDAEYLYQTQFYDEAFNRYKNLLTLDPGNSNILFRCGACCLNIPGNEEQAVTYLSEATPGITLDYKDRSHKEPGAPVLTYYMLGRAYHLDNQFDQAIENYQRYMDEGIDEDPLQREYASMQIEACERARLVLENQPSFEFHDVLQHFENDLPSCNNPVISGDGEILIFLVDYPADKKIMMTTLDGEYWTRPRVINSEIGMVGETMPVCLSYDGKDLYMVHQYYSHSDILVSHFENGRWSEAAPLNHNINGRTSETHASISKDGNTLYFTTDMRGGSGSFDIYVSKKDVSGEWGVAKNLGPVINTTYEEHTPFISSNDSILFFSSQGHASIGGVDVFYSELNELGEWGEPINIGYPVNTTGEDLFFNPGWDEMEGFYAVRRQSDPTTNAINMVIELEPEPERVADMEEKDDPTEVAEEETEVAVEVTEVNVEVTEEVEEESEELQTDILKVIEPEVTDDVLDVLNKPRIVEEPKETREPEPPVIPPVEGPITLLTGIPFNFNNFELNIPALLEVEKVADLMHAYPHTLVKLTGHTDASGEQDYNMLLSLQRANIISDYLEMRGIPEERVAISGTGEDAPIARNFYPDGRVSPLGRYLNRQVSVLISGTSPIEADLSGLYIPKSLRPDSTDSEESEPYSYWFTIQLLADLKPIETSRFQKYPEVLEHQCNDGYYRYTVGEYNDFLEARRHLNAIRRSGFKDAYIQSVEYYRNMSK